VILAAAIERYLADLALAHSPATVVSYRYGLHRFAEYLDARDRLPADTAALAVDLVVEYARWLMAVPPAASSRRTCDVYVAALAGFYGYLVREEIRPDLQLEAMRLRLRPLLGRRPLRLPRVPSDACLERLKAAARDHRPPGPRGDLVRLRNIAMLETLAGSGLRVSELVRLKRGDATRGDGRAVVCGKGRKERQAYFSPDAAAALAAYLAARGDGGGAEPLFARHDLDGPPRPLATNSVRATVEHLAQLAGIDDERPTPHRFRAWFATRVLDRTGDLAATQDLLGHESPETTRQYARVADRHLRAVHEAAFRSGV
jgi:site-specific recombinase XerD